MTTVSHLMQALRYATTEDKAEIYAGLKAGTRHSISADLAQPRRMAATVRDMQIRVLCTPVLSVGEAA